jgi:hypothetical protein
MTKPQLRVLAIVLSGLILVVLFAGLDDLPRKLRTDIASEQRSLIAAEKQVQKARAEVSADLQAEPALFRVRSMNTALPARLDRAESDLLAARKGMQDLQALAKTNRRTDREKAERLLKQERRLRTSAADDASAAAGEARHWIEIKQRLPEQVAQMERDYQALRSADLARLALAVQKAESDWPEKKSDLESRLVALTKMPADAERQWQSTAELRRKVAANDAAVDYVSLIGAADALHQESVELPKKAAELQNLSGQLYDGWDKILIDLNVRGGGDHRTYEEKLRTIRTHFTDVPAKKSEISKDDAWVQVSATQYQAVERNLGMAIEHKPAGKYDFEAEHVAQPAGFAYMAPPGQSNQYGYWAHQGGQSVWMWLPQYLILRDLMWNRYYPPMTTYEYEQYRTYRNRGQTYYGHDAAGSAPKYGSNGSVTQRQYADSNYTRSGGYRDSKYATKSGGYRDSQYATPSARSGESSDGRRFGRSEDTRSSQRGWSNHSGSRPAPRPSSPPRSSGGRSFGGRRR